MIAKLLMMHYKPNKTIKDKHVHKVRYVESNLFGHEELASCKER